MLLLLCLIAAYLFGSISTAIIVCKIMGLADPRTQGSGNPGATNVARIGGKKLGIFVLLGDILKGALPVLVAKILGISMMGLGLVALAVFLGHLYPIFFQFRGGKGVATALGAISVLAWPLAIVVIMTWLVVMIIFRYVSLASIVAAISVILFGWWLAPTEIYFPIILMSLLLIWRHRENIQRLLAGEEKKFSSNKN